MPYQEHSMIIDIDVGAGPTTSRCEFPKRDFAPIFFKWFASLTRGVAKATPKAWDKPKPKDKVKELNLHLSKRG